MKKTHVLIVDNLPTAAKMLAARLERAFDRAPTCCHSEAEALELLGRHEVDCALLDLDLGGGTKGGERFLEGIGLGEKIQRTWPHVGVMMYSTSINPRRPDSAGIVAGGKAAGAYMVLPRDHFFMAPLETLAEEISAAIDAVRPNDFTVSFKSSFRMNAILEVYDEASLKGLLRKLKPTFRFYCVKALQAGFSGAAVLHVTASNREDQVDASQWVLKIAPSRHPLEQEIARRPEFGTVADRTGVGAHDSEVASFGDTIYGFRTRFVTGMTLLGDYLRDGTAGAEAEGVLSGVVDQLMVPPLKAADGPVPGFVLKATAGVELIDFLEEAEKWTAVLSDDDRASVSATRRLVEQVLKADGRLPWTSGPAALLHGDFHGRNVFVAPRTEPKCIDFARRETFPRLFDFAALDADLNLGAIAARQGEDLKWEEVPRWKRDRLALFPFTQVYRSEPGSRTAMLLNLMLEQIRAHGGTSAEYAQVLAFRYWRYLRFPNVGPCKKILACHLIRELSVVTGTAVPA